MLIFILTGSAIRAIEYFDGTNALASEVMAGKKTLEQGVREMASYWKRYAAFLSCKLVSDVMVMGPLVTQSVVKLITELLRTITKEVLVFANEPGLLHASLHKILLVVHETLDSFTSELVNFIPKIKQTIDVKGLGVDALLATSTNTSTVTSMASSAVVFLKRAPMAIIGVLNYIYTLCASGIMVEFHKYVLETYAVFVGALQAIGRTNIVPIAMESPVADQGASSSS
jgi:hypothetical protein